MLGDADPVAPNGEQPTPASRSVQTSWPGGGYRADIIAVKAHRSDAAARLLRERGDGVRLDPRGDRERAGRPAAPIGGVYREVDQFLAVVADRYDAVGGLGRDRLKDHKQRADRLKLQRNAGASILFLEDAERFDSSASGVPRLGRFARHAKGTQRVNRLRLRVGHEIDFPASYGAMDVSKRGF